jgi:transposase
VRCGNGGYGWSVPSASTRSAAAGQQAPRGGRPPAFDAHLCKQRNVVERCVSRLKQFRDLATRYAQRAASGQAELTVAAIILWLR